MKHSATMSDEPIVRFGLPPKILYVEDHEVTRLGTRQVLQQLDPAIEIVEASSLGQLKALEDVCQNADLMLLDLGLPDVRGAVHIPQVRHVFPATPIVVLSGNDDPNVAIDAMQSGVAGFILKNSGAATILYALKLILAGEVFFPRHIMDHVRHVQLTAPEPSPNTSLLEDCKGTTLPLEEDETTAYDDAAPFENTIRLTRRQREVMRLVALGLANKDIARSLSISLGTAKNHVAEVLRILNCSNRRELIYKVLAPVQPHT